LQPGQSLSKEVSQSAEEMREALGKKDEEICALKTENLEKDMQNERLRKEMEKQTRELEELKKRVK